MNVDTAVWIECVKHERCATCPLHRVKQNGEAEFFCRSYDNKNLINILPRLGYDLDSASVITVTEDSFIAVFGD